ncbi:MAG: thiopurine S-methyltransferase [Deltaproteobacteria bacterium]|nr:thiopurine S-methyltransferase [Deltaproteobacteria bacterium]
MEPQFWRDRWAEGKTAFHEGKPNSFLTQFLARMTGKRVLVPLCGKADDLSYLASEGREVVGIELVEDAVKAFFDEHSLTPTVDGNRYTAGPITLIASDIFAIDRKQLGTIDAIYDRAALVALPPDLRPRYVAHLRAAVADTVPGLLVSIEYPQERMEGPPFSVPETEVRTYYPKAQLLAEQPLTSGRAAELGVAIERCYSVTW